MIPTPEPTREEVIDHIKYAHEKRLHMGLGDKFCSLLLNKHESLSNKLKNEPERGKLSRAYAVGGMIFTHGAARFVCNRESVQREIEYATKIAPEIEKGLLEQYHKFLTDMNQLKEKIEHTLPRKEGSWFHRHHKAITDGKDGYKLKGSKHHHKNEKEKVVV